MCDSNNLGVYNNDTIYNEYKPNVNGDIAQGTDFMNYRKLTDNNEKNKYSLLFASSSPELDSIVEAFRDGDDSTQLRYSRDTIDRELSENQRKFNSLLTSYATAYKTYNASLLNKKPTEDDLEQRARMENHLNRIYRDLTTLAITIKNDINKLNATTQRIGRDDKYDSTKIHRDIMSKMNELTAQRKKMEDRPRYHQATINGKLETTNLNTTSIEAHYIVYFIVTITIIAYVFYIALSPNADVIHATYVVIALVVVYVVSRWVI